MGVSHRLSAALKKGDQEDILILENGRQLPLGRSLPYADGAELVVEIMDKQSAAATQEDLAKHILQEILSGGA
ncbi:MAG: hypothetical protein V1826_02375 [bacterium]